MHFYPQQTDKGWLLYVWLLACLVAVSTIPPIAWYDILNMAHKCTPPPRCFRIQHIVGILLCLSSSRCRWHCRNGGAAIGMCGSVDCCVFCINFCYCWVIAKRWGVMIHFTSPPSMAVICWRSYTRRRIVVVDMPMPPMPSITRTKGWYDADGWLLYAHQW